MKDHAPVVFTSEEFADLRAVLGAWREMKQNAELRASNARREARDYLKEATESFDKGYYGDAAAQAESAVKKFIEAGKTPISFVHTNLFYYWGC
jgi:hypothetical protein